MMTTPQESPVYSRDDATALFLATAEVWDAPMPFAVKDGLAEALRATGERIETALDESHEIWLAVPGVDDSLVAFAKAVRAQSLLQPDNTALAAAWAQGYAARRDGGLRTDNPYGQE